MGIQTNTLVHYKVPLLSWYTSCLGYFWLGHWTSRRIVGSFSIKNNQKITQISTPFICPLKNSCWTLSPYLGPKRQIACTLSTVLDLWMASSRGPFGSHTTVDPSDRQKLKTIWLSNAHGRESSGCLTRFCDLRGQHCASLKLIHEVVIHGLGSRQFSYWNGSEDVLVLVTEIDQILNRAAFPLKFCSSANSSVISSRFHITWNCSAFIGVFFPFCVCQERDHRSSITETLKKDFLVLLKELKYFWNCSYIQNVFRKKPER